MLKFEMLLEILYFLEKFLKQNWLHYQISIQLLIMLSKYININIKLTVKSKY